MNTKITIFLLLMLFPIGMAAQTDQSEKRRLMQQADSVFDAGEYVQARNFYVSIYAEFDDSIAKARISKCDQCRDLLIGAAEAERSGRFFDAVEQYRSVRKLNPRDPKVSGLIESCTARQYAPLLQSAKQLYREGKYAEARGKLNEYTARSGRSDNELLTAIMKGLAWSNEAHVAFDIKEYSKAKNYYDSILIANPTDAIAAQALAEVNKLSQPTKTVYIDQSSYKNKNQVNGTAMVYSIIPGLGLIQKGYKAEGMVYLVGDIALLGAGIGLHSYAGNQKKVMNDRNTGIDRYNKAKSNYNAARTVGSICFGAAAGLYVVNLIRSYVAKPKPGAKLQWFIAPERLSSLENSMSNRLLNVSLCYTF